MVAEIYVTIPNWFWEQSDLDIGQIFSFIRFDQFSNKLNWKFMVSSIRRNTHKTKHHQNVTVQIYCLQIALITNTNHLIKIISYTDLQWHWSIWICLQITIWLHFHIFDILFKKSPSEKDIQQNIYKLYIWTMEMHACTQL